jgi:hypothetical protein
MKMQLPKYIKTIFYNPQIIYMNTYNRCYWIAVLLGFFAISSFAQRDYWHQTADYKMDIDFDVKKHRYSGKQNVWYTNHSPDTLHRVFYHLYLNAFQPNSMMDKKSRTIKDPDSRVKDRIFFLTDDEIGYLKVKKLFLDGVPCTYSENETILVVDLPKPIIPGQSVNLDLEFEAQVPLQIRRTGRHNEEGVEYSMAQWYPKLCQYDYLGWHANPYIGREFYGHWGDFEVNISIDSRYILAGSGVLTNAEEIGYGYSDYEPKKRAKKQTWNFKAERVHDFVWAADPKYVHETYTAHDGTIFRMFYIPGEKTTENWKLLPGIMDEALRFMNGRYGKYPYPVYSFIQGGDGGMEYPMATLITGHRPLISLVGVSIHEFMHSWYHGVLATNETLYPWMDEGFTTYGSNETMNHLRQMKLIPGLVRDNPNRQNVMGYINLRKSGFQEPLSTHADHYITNYGYGAASYTMGALYLMQLDYIMGSKSFNRALLRYFDDWGFKHPTPNDFIRVMEKESGMQLRWFSDHWINSTRAIDYGIDSLFDKTLIIANHSDFAMPLDVLITHEDGRKFLFYIPQSLTFGNKEADLMVDQYVPCEPWFWTHPQYELKLPFHTDKIALIEIDPSGRMADVNPDDNVHER